MNLQAVFAYLQERKIALSVDNGELVVRASQGVIDLEALALLKLHKHELLIAVRQDPDAWGAGDSAQAIKITPDMLPLISLTQEQIDRIVDSVPQGVANIQDIYPLAPLQEGILFHHLLETKGDTYLLRSVMAFETRHFLDDFLAALQTVINRHDILRSAVRWADLRQPVQVVYRQAPLVIEEFTLTKEAGALRQLLAHADPSHVRLDLQRAPLLAAYIAADPHSDEWLLVLLSHHIVCDHITLELIIAEIQLLLQQREYDLPVPLPYRDFIAQARAVSADEHQAYFRQWLGDINEPTAPFGLLNVQGSEEQITEASLALDDDLARSIRDCARQLGVNAAVLFHVAWALVLAQCSGRQDVVFGTVLSGRLQGSAGADRVLGVFINTLPIRISLADASVKEIVRETYQRLTELLIHEQASLALAQRCSGVDASMPLFTTLLNYRHSHQVDGSAGQLSWKGMRVILSGEERTNYPITLSVDDFGQGFSLTAQCIPGIEPERIAAYLGTAITALVNALTQNPQQLLSRLNIIPAAERQQLLVDWNATTAEYPHEQCIHQLFEQQVEKTPDAIAVVFDNQSLGYDELNQRANQVARHLVAFGIRPDSRVAICMERSLDMIVGLLGILKAGGAYVPLDPNYPVERLSYMIGDCAPAALVTQAALQDRFPIEGIPKVVLDLEGDVVNTAIAQQPKGNLDPVSLGLCARHLAYVIYTSGSTGQPKGVMIEHSNTVNFISWAKTNFSSGRLSHTLFSTSINFDLAVYELFVPLSTGATVHLVDDLLALNDSLDCISLVNTVPSVMNALIGTGQVPPSVRSINLAGEPLKQALVESIFASTQARTVANLYGPTETTTYSTWVTIDKAQAFPCHIGRPIANTQIYILDAELQPVPLGVSGEIYIGGAGVVRGYLNRPELSAERFIPDPFTSNAKDNARLYRTGDLGRWLASGNIEYLGRNDFQVKIRGFRIELGEIEAQLALCQGVREAVVIAREDDPNEKRLVAYLLTQDNIELPAAEIRKQLAAVLADYMIPATFVCMPSFPLTPNGKIDRKALPKPDYSGMASQHYAAPRTETEKILAELWMEVLGVEKVGVEDNFFDLGGHSLLATQLISRICIRFRIDLQLKNLFETKSVAQLANKIDLLVWAKEETASQPNTVETELEEIEL